MDAVTGESRTIPGSKPDASLIVGYDDSALIWLATHEEPTEEDIAAPPGTRHVMYWAIKRYDFATGRLQIIDRGYNHWITDDPYTHWPYIAVYADQIAYDVETTGADTLARIVVRTISTGQVVRTIDVGSAVFDISLSEDGVTYLTGDVSDPPWPAPDNPKLIRSSADGSAQQLPYDPEASSSSTFEENGMTVTQTFAGFEGNDNGWFDLTFDRGPASTVNRLSGEHELAHGDGLVVWDSDALSQDGDRVGRNVSIFDTGTRSFGIIDSDVSQSYRIYVSGLGVGDGWLVWTTQNQEPVTNIGYNLTAHAVRTSDVHAAFESLSGGE